MKYETALGWNGPDFKDLIGRDLSVEEGDEIRRGPLVKIETTLSPERGDCIISFRVGWVALKENRLWRLERETEDPRGICACGINPGPEYTYVAYDPLTKVLKMSSRVGEMRIYRQGDNLSKPEIPTTRPGIYQSDFDHGLSA